MRKKLEFTAEEKKDKQRKVIYVRLIEKLFFELKKEAKKNKVPVSTFARKLIEEYFCKELS